MFIFLLHFYQEYNARRKFRDIITLHVGEEAFVIVWRYLSDLYFFVKSIASVVQIVTSNFLKHALSPFASNGYESFQRLCCL